MGRYSEWIFGDDTVGGTWTYGEDTIRGVIGRTDTVRGRDAMTVRDKDTGGIYSEGIVYTKYMEKGLRRIQ